MTKTEREVIDKLRGMRIDLNPPEEWVHLSVEKEVLNRRVRTGGTATRLHRPIRRKAGHILT